ncbi:MAG TPA: hypothetical protein VHA52_02670 [Candidatus Babeliaceae bacterium]|nr:hypothetical protein [Candidatus Babeliaceae bacterium]
MKLKKFIAVLSGVSVVIEAGNGDSRQRCNSYSHDNHHNCRASNDNEAKAISTWIKENKLNKYGDPIGTIYRNDSPLLQEVSLYHYLCCQKFKDKDKPWLSQSHMACALLVAIESGIADSRPRCNSYSHDNHHNCVPLNKEEEKAISAWIKENKLNEYGDPQGTVYANGSPLLQEVSLYHYLCCQKFKDKVKPWLPYLIESSR